MPPQEREIPRSAKASRPIRQRSRSAQRAGQPSWCDSYVVSPPEGQAESGKPLPTAHFEINGQTQLACRIKRMEAPREGDLLHREYFAPDTGEVRRLTRERDLHGSRSRRPPAATRPPASAGCSA